MTASEYKATAVENQQIIIQIIGIDLSINKPDILQKDF